jgi:hypothetical protein
MPLLDHLHFHIDGINALSLLSAFSRIHSPHKRRVASSTLDAGPDSWSCSEKLRCFLKGSLFPAFSATSAAIA